MANTRITESTFISAFVPVGYWKGLRQKLIDQLLWDNFDEADWDAAYVLFEQRIRTRFLNPINAIFETGRDQGEGFSIVALQCILIEFLEAFYLGKVYSLCPQTDFEYKASGPLFESFLMTHEPFSSHFIHKHNAQGFYENIRCGLLHEAATKGSSKINNAPYHNKIVLFENEENPGSKDRKNMRIYRENFHQALLEFIESYQKSFKVNRALKVNFIRKMDDICGIKHVYYFAYGSNMLPKRLLDRIGRYHRGVLALLRNYEFAYNKISTVDKGTSKANLRDAPEESVRGVCFEIDHDDIATIRKHEGGYDQRIVEVEIEGHKKKAKAITFISNSTDDSLTPTEEYRGLIIDGAEHWKLDKSYITQYL